jgi:hypothetical protein
VQRDRAARAGGRDQLGRRGEAVDLEPDAELDPVGAAGSGGLDLLGRPAADLD